MIVAYNFGTQLQTLEVLKDFIAEHGYSPTIPELAARRKLHRVTIYGHVNELLARGKLKRVSGQRNLRLTYLS